MFDKKEMLKRMKKRRRTTRRARRGDEGLGPLELLPGKWRNIPGTPGHGWNMIALPFAGGDGVPVNPLHYRLLVNQYNETLEFTDVSDSVPNRGLIIKGCEYGPDAKVMPGNDGDQFVAALDYSQVVTQIAQDDFPQSGLAGNKCDVIHHEPGLFLHMINHETNCLDIARSASIPHGDSVLALGRSSEVKGANDVPDLSGLPEGVSQDLDSPYLAPYKHFHDNLFEGVFDPTKPNELLAQANQGVDIVKTTVLDLDTTLETGGIHNIPFVVKQANASEMKSIFWIQELAEKDEFGQPVLRLQYSQVVMLDFFQRRDGAPGLIRWPHVSINTLVKVPEDPNAQEPDEPNSDCP